jgi:undecaprenyl-diphosphatase
MDTSLLHALNGFFFHHDAVEDPVVAYVNAAELLFAGMLVAAFLFVGGHRRRDTRRAAAAAGLSAGVALAIAHVLATIVDRPRPFVADPSAVHIFTRHAADPGFPSDHATAAFAIAVAIFLYSRRAGIAFLAVASLIAPGLLAVEWARHKPLEVPVVAACAAALFLLVVVRMSGLVREVHAQLEVVQARDASLASALSGLRRAQAERKRLLERTIRAAEDERLQMAAELHDGPIQHLAALGYSLESATTVMEQDPGGGRRLVRHVQDGLSEEIKGLRQLMVTLRPPALDQAGLHMALRDFVEAVASQEGLEASIHVEEVHGLSPEAETVLYRVAQEALRNVVRHADASSVTVTLRGAARAAEVSVQDDGVGFTPDGTDFVRDGHFGIAGMRQRVEMVGGTLDIDSARGSGASVRARVPNARSEGPEDRDDDGRSRPAPRRRTRRIRLRAGRGT